MATDIATMEKNCRERLSWALTRCQPSGGKPHLVCRLIHKNHGQEDAGATFHVLRGVLEEWSPVMCAKLHFGNRDVQTAEAIEEQEIIIDEFDQEITKHFTFFLYNGRVDCDSMPVLLELARMAGYYDVVDLKKLCMYYLSSIFFANPQVRLPSVQDFQSASFELRDLLILGCHPRMLVACGFSFRQFMEAQATHGCLRRAGFSAEYMSTWGVHKGWAVRADEFFQTFASTLNFRDAGDRQVLRNRAGEIIAPNFVAGT